MRNPQKWKDARSYWTPRRVIRPTATRATQRERFDALFSAAARHNLPKIPGDKTGPIPARPNGVGNEARIAVLINRNAKRVSPSVVDVLGQIAGSDLFVTRTLSEARDVARRVVDEGYKTVMLGGGDGTFVEWTSDIVQHAEATGRAVPRFAVLPLGTGNAVAMALGSGSAKARELPGLVRRAQEMTNTRPMDLLEVDGRLTPFAGFGLDALILEDHLAVEQAFRNMGMPIGPNTGYALSVALKSLPRFAFADYPEVTVTNIGRSAFAMDTDGRPYGASIPAGDVLYRGRACIASASTIQYVGLSMRLFPQVGRHRGYFQLRVSDAGVLEILGHLPAVWRGTYRSDSIQDFLCTAVEMEITPACAFQVGGDVIGRRERVVIELAERRVRILS